MQLIESFVEQPNITFPMDSYQFTANEETDAIFTCTATGSPAPSISFLYDETALTRTEGRPLTMGGTIPDRVMLSTEHVVMNNESNIYEVSRTLTLFNVGVTDRVNFTCLASSDLPRFGNRSANSSFSLFVYRKLLF